MNSKHPGRRNCIQASSNDCDCPAKTDFRLGKQGKFGKSELCHTGNRIEVSRHSTAKLNKMKTDKYKDPTKREVVEVDDNIKMEGPDESATGMAKINFEKKGNTEVCHVCAKEFFDRLSLLQHMKVHKRIQHQCDKCSYKTPTKKYLIAPNNRNTLRSNF